MIWNIIGKEREGVQIPEKDGIIANVEGCSGTESPGRGIGISDTESPSIVGRLSNEWLVTEVNSFVPLGWKGKRHPI